MSRFKKSKMIFAVLMVTLLLMAPVAGVFGATAPDKLINNELVISNFDDQGEIADIQVLNQLRFFGNGSYTIEDSTRFKLSSVRNLFGSEKIVQKDNGLTVKVSIPSGQNFGDVYYLSGLTKEEVGNVKFPVSVKVEYFLDGQKIAPSQLAGKSGHLKIATYVENLTGAVKTLEFADANGEMISKEIEVYTPYVVSLSGWAFSNKNFANVVAPGIDQESPGGVIVTIKDQTTVSWTVPLIPPKYPAKQYVVLEADAKNIELPSLKIAVIPVLPTTSEIDSLSTVGESLAQLYGGFDTIQKGVGDQDKDATLLFGLNSVKGGVSQISEGMGTLIANLKIIRVGLSNSSFDASTYNGVTGTDAQGESPGLKDAVGMLKDGVEERALPAYGLQKVILGTFKQSIGSAGVAVEEPTDSSSLYNDVEYLKSQLTAEQQQIITGSIEPKLNRLAGNVQVFVDGGNIATGTGRMPFPANVSALEQGSKETLAALQRVDAGLGLMTVGVGMLDRNGSPMKVMVNGKPGNILYALDYMKSGIDGEMIPGINQILDGTGQIGSGAGEAKEVLYTGMQAIQSSPVLVSALSENAALEDTFLGKPAGSIGTLAYVFQTPAVNTQASALKIGLGVIVVALIILVAIGRAPKQSFKVSSEHA